MLFDTIDNSTRDEIVELLCPNNDKFYAWNFLPSRSNGIGSIEFRRAPGVATAKKSKHWIAFTMSFVFMALQSNPAELAAKVSKKKHLDEVYHPEFAEDLLNSAKDLGILPELDARLLQPDDVDRLYITMMSQECRDWLNFLDLGYQFS